MTIDEYKQTFLPIKPSLSPAVFLKKLRKNQGSRFHDLYLLFGKTFALAKLEYDFTETGNIIDSSVDSIEIISSVKDNEEITSFKKNQTDNQTALSVQQIAEELYCFLIYSIVRRNRIANTDIRLWRYYREGLVYLLRNPIRHAVLKLVDEKYLLPAGGTKSFWWYAIKVWRDNDIIQFDDNIDDNTVILSAIKLILRVEIPPEGILALYYTALSSLDYIFPSKESPPNNNRFHPSIMSVSTMNDPEEGHILQEFLDEENKHSHRYWWNLAPAGKREKLRYHCIEPYVFCKSFTNSDRIDDLSMWEVYGDRAEGACCVIRVHGQGSQCLYNIAYFNRDDMKVVQIGGEHRLKSNAYKFELLDNLLLILKEIVAEDAKYGEVTASRWREYIMSIAYLFKYDSYSHENEIRFLYSLIGDEIGAIKGEVKTVGGSKEEKTLPILSVSAKVAFEYLEVILGPKVKNPDNAAAYLIHQFKVATGSDELPLITKSAIHYR